MIKITKEDLIKDNLDLSKLLVLIISKYNLWDKIKAIKDNYEKDGIIIKKLFGTEINERYEDLLRHYIIIKGNDIDVNALAIELKKIYPKGKKEGTNYYWTDGVAIIAKRLKAFFNKYGNIYTSEQIIKATKKYVGSFMLDYRYMKLLKYFIFKEENDNSSSELINYIENYNEKDNFQWDKMLK